MDAAAPIDIARLRQETAMIFQDPMMTLNPVLRIDTQMIETVRGAGYRLTQQLVNAA